MKIEKKHDKCILTPEEVLQVLRAHIFKETGRDVVVDNKMAHIHVTSEGACVAYLEEKKGILS